MKHEISKTGLHIITIGKRVHVFTELEYAQLEWWDYIKLKYFGRS